MPLGISWSAGVLWFMNFEFSPPPSISVGSTICRISDLKTFRFKNSFIITISPTGPLTAVCYDGRLITVDADALSRITWVGKTINLGEVPSYSVIKTSEKRVIDFRLGRKYLKDIM